ncbi:hypothetical protein [Halomarina pelagica]|uniref:hypothetical protein n=1 Tax=Halomarina pelagica TaxID=2961599 RepID=UPI0020C4366B|nr:hypothetical protein [Halomarina sp. BND7]
MPAERASPSAGWREVYRAMDAPEPTDEDGTSARSHRERRAARLSDATVARDFDDGPEVRRGEERRSRVTGHGP